MAADLHIHVVTDDISEKEMKDFVRRAYTVYEAGESKDFKDYSEDGTELHFDEKKIHSTPNIWVGEVSWLKAGFLEDSESFIPQTIMKISELVGTNLPVIDDKFIEEVKEAFKLPNNTAKPDGVNAGEGYSKANIDDVVEFLEQYKGKKVFQISW